MWVYLTDALLSIVAHREQPEALLVRARFPGDIERVFPAARVTETPGADYRFRATLPREAVAQALAAAAQAIDYPNFKATLRSDTKAERERAESYHHAHDAALQSQAIVALAERRPKRFPGGIVSRF